MSSQVKKAKMHDSESGPSKQDTSSKVVTTSMPASVSVALHPLVIMNISDHYTRIKAQQGIIPSVYGALLGKQNGRNMELFNSFELRHSSENGIDMEYLKNKEEQFRQVFTDLDFLGWYTVGSSAANEKDILIQRQLLSVNESPLLLKLDALSKSSNLPVTIYESMMDIVDDQPRMLFIEVAYTLITEEAERIGVDHVARLSANGSSQTSQASEYMLTQRSAVKMLHSRICIIKKYVQAVKNGEIELNHDIMRDCMSLCQRLPLLNTDSFDQSFFEQYNDINLMTFLAAITKGCNIANELIAKFNIVYDRHSHGRIFRKFCR